MTAPYTRAERMWRRDLRRKLAHEQNGLCCWCRSVMGADVTIEHLKPKSKRGPDVKRNMKAACSHCNNTRGSMAKGAFMKRIKHPSPQDSRQIWHIYIRRRLNLCTERALKRMAIAFGLPIPAGIAPDRARGSTRRAGD